MGDSVIYAEHVTYIYPDGTVGIEDVNLEILHRNKVAVIGPNGSGKSTLLMLFAGLLKPTSGKMKIFGMDLKDKNLNSLRKRIGIVFQNPDDFLFNPTVIDELLYTPTNLGIDIDRAKNLAMKFSDIFEIKHILNKPPFRLSGGEKKRVMLACVLMLNPQLLLLDEPFTNVDKKTRDKIIKIVENYDGTVVISTHETEYIKKIVEKVIVLSEDKRVRAYGDISLLDEIEEL